MTDHLIDEINLIRREQTLPDELADSPAFMQILILAQMGLNDAERDALYSVAAVAFSAGRVAGAKMVTQLLNEPPSNVVKIR